MNKLQFLTIAILFILPFKGFSRINNQIEREIIINLPKEQSLSIYPVPVINTLNITFSQPVAEVPIVSLYDIIGNLVYSGEPESSDAAHFVIDFNDRKPGYYFLKVKSGDFSFARRITVRP